MCSSLLWQWFRLTTSNLLVIQLKFRIANLLKRDMRALPFCLMGHLMILGHLQGNLPDHRLLRHLVVVCFHQSIIRYLLRLMGSLSGQSMACLPKVYRHHCFSLINRQENLKIPLERRIRQAVQLILRRAFKCFLVVIFFALQ